MKKYLTSIPFALGAILGVAWAVVAYNHMEKRIGHTIDNAGFEKLGRYYDIDHQKAQQHLILELNKHITAEDEDVTAWLLRYEDNKYFLKKVY